MTDTNETAPDSPKGGWCIDCGTAPRPKRTNWHRIPEDVFDVDPYHHRCHACYREWDRVQRNEARSTARAFIEVQIHSTQSKKKIAKCRKAHVCDVDGCPIDTGSSYWRCTLTGPRDVKVCETCMARIMSVDNDASIFSRLKLPCA